MHNALQQIYGGWWGSVFLGTEVTNNEAEHEGLILGLQAAVRRFSWATLHVGRDTKLVVNQIAGESSGLQAYKGNIRRVTVSQCPPSPPPLFPHHAGKHPLILGGGGGFRP